MLISILRIVMAHNAMSVVVMYLNGGDTNGEAEQDKASDMD